jgi:hypothetical protein
MNNQRAIKHISIHVRNLGDDDWMVERSPRYTDQVVLAQWAELTQEEKIASIKKHTNRNLKEVQLRSIDRLHHAQIKAIGTLDNPDARILPKAWAPSSSQSRLPASAAVRLGPDDSQSDEYRIIHNPISTRKSGVIQAISFANDMREEDLLAIVEDRLSRTAEGNPAVQDALKHVQSALNCLHTEVMMRLSGEVDGEPTSEEQELRHAYEAFGRQGVLNPYSTHPLDIADRNKDRSDNPLQSERLPGPALKDVFGENGEHPVYTRAWYAAVKVRLSGEPDYWTAVQDAITAYIATK